jgi:hypothetical protein
MVPPSRIPSSQLQPTGGLSWLLLIAIYSQVEVFVGLEGSGVGQPASMSSRSARTYCTVSSLVTFRTTESRASAYDGPACKRVTLDQDQIGLQGGFGLS